MFVLTFFPILMFRITQTKLRSSYIKIKLPLRCLDLFLDFRLFCTSYRNFFFFFNHCQCQNLINKQLKQFARKVNCESEKGRKRGERRARVVKWRSFRQLSMRNDGPSKLEHSLSIFSFLFFVPRDLMLARLKSSFSCRKSSKTGLTMGEDFEWRMVIPLARRRK